MLGGGGREWAGGGGVGEQPQRALRFHLLYINDSKSHGSNGRGPGQGIGRPVPIVAVASNNLCVWPWAMDVWISVSLSVQ